MGNISINNMRTNVRAISPFRRKAAEHNMVTRMSLVPIEEDNEKKKRSRIIVLYNACLSSCSSPREGLLAELVCTRRAFSPSFIFLSFHLVK